MSIYPVMATATPLIEPGSAFESELDETSIISALARLQEMHIAVCPIRILQNPGHI